MLERARSTPAPLVLLLLAGAWSAAVPPAAAQDSPGPAPAASGARSAPFRASAYLPLGHWAYPALERWVSLGRIRSLSPLVRPYRRLDVAREVRRLEEERLEGFEEALLERLRNELEPELAFLRADERSGASGWVRFAGGATYRTQQHRDPLRPELDGEFAEDGAFERMSVRFSGEAGILAGGFLGVRDKLFVHDAQFPNGRVVPRKEFPLFDEGAFRIEEAYAELQTKYASVSFGRMYRNWGLPGLPGFLRSDYAYSEEEIGYRFGTRRIFLAGSFASYGDFRGDTTHYHSIHRLEIRPLDDLVIALSEAVVHGGPSQKLDFRFVNPISIWQFARTDGDPTHNVIGQADVWVRPVRGLAVYGSFLADATNLEGSCCQIGGTVGLELPDVAPGWIARVDFTAIQSLAYRTSLPWEEYSVENIGLGWDKTDLYLARLRATWFAHPWVELRPGIDVQVKGEGDFRQLRPPFDQLPTFPRILVGEAETTIRPLLGGRVRTPTSLPIDVEWDFGLNFISDYRNVAGDDRTEVVATVRALIETPRLGFRLD